MMDACAEVYITKDYSVELSEDDIKSIARDVRIAAKISSFCFWTISRSRSLLALA